MSSILPFLNVLLFAVVITNVCPGCSDEESPPPGCKVDDDCNDDNVCTDDTCNADGTCSYENNTSKCDDGIFCNGADTCISGACSVHTGDPCGDAGCDETFDICIDETWYDLGGSDFGPWTYHLRSSSWGGGISADTGRSQFPSLALDGEDRPIVAWKNESDAPSDREHNVYVKRYDGKDWVEVGAGSASEGGISDNMPGFSIGHPSLALDGEGHPVVTWRNTTTAGDKIFVKRYNGNAWVEVGAGSASGGGIGNAGSDPSLAIDIEGRPVVAWIGSGEVYLKRFDGNEWVEVGAGSASGGGISNTGSVTDPSLAIDGEGRPVVAWVANYPSENEEIYVKRYDGNAWVEVGAVSASGGGISSDPGNSNHPSLALDDEGRPVVAWENERRGNYGIYVKRYDGNNWVAVGSGSTDGVGIGNDTGFSELPKLALDGDGRPVVMWAWMGQTSGYPAAIYVKRFDGNAWVDVGSGSSCLGLGYPSLALDGEDQPVIAWQDVMSGNSEIYVERFDGNDWVEVRPGLIAGGGISDNEGSSLYPSLVLDGEGWPVVAWHDDTPGVREPFEIYVKRYDGNDWVDVGAGSSDGGGISANTGDSQHTSLALDGEGRPVVAWENESVDEPSNVFIKRYDGNDWVEVGAGSASGGGISDTTGNSQHPTLALDVGGLPVLAWHDRTPGRRQIYLKRYDGSSWVEVGAGSADGGGISDNPDIHSRYPSLALDGEGRPVVAWCADIFETWNAEIVIKRYDGSGWVDVWHGSADGGGVRPSMVLDGEGWPVVAWDEGKSWWDPDGHYWVGPHDIYVMRYDGNDWVEVGAGSGSEGGISANTGNSLNPSLALDGEGQPVVAWHDDTSGNYEIYIKRFNGTDWMDVGSGSSTGGGVSNSRAESLNVSLATGGGRMCIAWQEAGKSSQEIVLRCSDE